MITFIKGQLINIRNSIDKANTDLASLSMESAIASDFKAKTIAALQALAVRIDNIIGSGILENEIFTRNCIIKFNSMNNAFIEIELFRYLAIRRYDSKADGHFEKVIVKIYDEIQCLQSIPFLSTISNSDTYYWAYPSYNMIALPQGEEKNLLNLSDLYHEIGHLIFRQSRVFLLGDFLIRMEEYCKKEIQRLADEDNITISEAIDASRPCWASSWSEEFTCDLIGTFLVGPAFAWTNLKISIGSSRYDGVFSNEDMYREHPPDEARMRAVFKMLELTGFATELAEIKIVWEKFLMVTKNTKPGAYDFIFPDSLIDVLATNVFKGCVNVGLRPYSEQALQQGKFVSKTINEAWLKIKEDPHAFKDWESAALATLI